MTVLLLYLARCGISLEMFSPIQVGNCERVCRHDEWAVAYVCVIRQHNERIKDPDLLFSIPVVTSTVPYNDDFPFACPLQLMPD